MVSNGRTGPGLLQFPLGLAHPFGRIEVGCLVGPLVDRGHCLAHQA